MTLVVNSPFQAELSTGADLSHAQLGWGQGGSWHCTLESLPLTPLLSLAGEEGTTLSVGQSGTDLGRGPRGAGLNPARRPFWDAGSRSAAPHLHPTPPPTQVGGFWGLSVWVHPASWLLLATNSPSELMARWAGFGC